MHPLLPYNIFPSGDMAITIEFGHIINTAVNEVINTLYHFFYNNPFGGCVEVVPAYTSITIYYDPLVLSKQVLNNETISATATRKIEEVIQAAGRRQPQPNRELSVPVCYDPVFAIDMAAIAEHSKMNMQEIVTLHSGTKYRVYMLGFLPGFAYMGEVDERLNLPRKKMPQKIASGSVGITGRQTGIYPLNSPGGWNIIGRTPVQLFETSGDTIHTFFEPGDIVKFYPISKNEFKNYKGGSV